MMRRIIVFIIVLIGGFLVYRVVVNIMTPDPLPPTSGTTIVALGDSLVTGIGASSGNDFVSLLSARINEQIINRGIPGDTTEDALARLEKDVLDEDPRIVLVLIGGNDALKNIPHTQTFDNIERMIDRIHARGAAVILIGIRGNLVFDTYRKEFSRLAKEKRVWYIADALKGLFGDTRYMADQIHPNDGGYIIIADRVEPVLRQVLNQ